MPALAAFLSRPRPWGRGSPYSMHSSCPALKRVTVCQTHTWAGSCPCSLRSFLAMNMSWCPAVWVSGGSCYGSTQVFSPNFSFIVITKIPLMVKYSMLFQSINLLITLGF